MHVPELDSANSIISKERSMIHQLKSNIIPKDKLRIVQIETLDDVSSILERSFGPNGSNTCIQKNNALNRYTKDGHTILGAITYTGCIEDSIKEDLESITRHIVKTVGDGTTSAIMLSASILKGINRLEEEKNIPPADLIRKLEEVVAMVKAKILESSNDLTVEDVYDIAMISTNGDTEVASVLTDIYKEFGNGVFIDVNSSTGTDFVIKSYNGMTLDAGFSDSCYISDQKRNVSVVDNPEVYIFEHPIDTKEMGVLLDAILSHNIVTPVNKLQKDPTAIDLIVPTVIFAPRISQDMSSLMDAVINVMQTMPPNNKLPICIISEYQQPERLSDLATLCGAKLIRKYIDPRTFDEDVKAGRAPTPETIFNWAGSCDQIVSYSEKTVFIRPKLMYNEDGSYSNIYYNLLNFLKSEISKGTEDGHDASTLGDLKRRLHSLESNMVELFVGGITQADRDARRDLVEDAVLNVRSAAQNGVGFGANMSAVCALYSLFETIEGYDETEKDLLHMLIDSYYDIIKKLFNVSSENEVSSMITRAITNKEIWNIREGRFSTNVKSSIMSDIVILESVCKIVGIMATCNQFIIPNPALDVYH